MRFFGTRCLAFEFIVVARRFENELKIHRLVDVSFAMKGSHMGKLRSVPRRQSLWLRVIGDMVFRHANAFG